MITEHAKRKQIPRSRILFLVRSDTGLTSLPVCFAATVWEGSYSPVIYGDTVMVMALYNYGNCLSVMAIIDYQTTSRI